MASQNRWNSMQTPTPQLVSTQLHKLDDADADIRFMALNDLFAMVANGPTGLLAQDPTLSARVVDGLLKSLDDINGEVQNLAVKDIGPLVAKMPPELWPPAVERISNLKPENSIDSSIPYTALRMVISSLPNSVASGASSDHIKRAYDTISKVVLVRLIGYRITAPNKKLPPQTKPLLDIKGTNGADGDVLEVLIEVIRSFGPMLQAVEVEALQRAAIDIIEHTQTSSTVKKKAVVANSLLAAYLSNQALNSVVADMVTKFSRPHLPTAQRRLLLTLVGSLARAIPSKIGPYLGMLAQYILAALTEDEFQKQLQYVSDNGEPDLEQDELREAALIALDACLGSCAQDMKDFTPQVIEAVLRFLSYDPSYSDPDSDEEMEGDEDGLDEDDEEGFEQEDGLSDDDDSTWKIRRCSAKAAHTLINTRSNGDLLENGTLYGLVAPILVDRFGEREENVRLEILAAMASLISKTGGDSPAVHQAMSQSFQGSFMGPPASRKRRRGGSDVSMLENDAHPMIFNGADNSLPSSQSGPLASLSTMVPKIISKSVKLLKLNSVPTKQSVIMLLRKLVIIQHGNLTEHLGSLMNSIAESTSDDQAGGPPSRKSMASQGRASTTDKNLRIESLRLIAALCEMHATVALAPHFEKFVPGVLAAVDDGNSKASCSALVALEKIIEALTPPRQQYLDEIQKKYLDQAFRLIAGRVSASDTDSEVRTVAFRCLGTLLSHTLGKDGEKFLSQNERVEGLELLKNRLQNEVTKLAAARAIEIVALQAHSKGDLSATWFHSVAIELSAQLRKSNRTLRLNCLSALRSLVASDAGSQALDISTNTELAGNLLPYADSKDLQVLLPILATLIRLIECGGSKAITPAYSLTICNLAKTPLSGPALEALMNLTELIGKTGSGQELMKGLLNEVGVNGDPATVGRLIGTLLVHGGNDIGVGLQDFEKEIRSSTDELKICLALSVLGEAGFLLGATSTLSPETFTQHFQSQSDRVRLSAAAALGRAGAADTQKYLPTIISGMTGTGNLQYLLLHSIKEVLHQSSDFSNDSIIPFLPNIWKNFLQAPKTEDNKSIGAECIGRIALVEPKTYIPLIHDQLSNRDPATRGVMIHALRYFLSDADESYNDILRGTIVSSLQLMLSDSNLENKRLALTTLNSATNNKPELVLPKLGSLLPQVIAETHINFALIREVTMGPFKHKVDDGLEVRKSSYETLYALMETAFAKMDVIELYDRVLAGLDDDNDIRALCNLMLAKLITLSPLETSRRVGLISKKFQSIISFKPKDNAVKQEIEKADEARKSAIKASYLLNNAISTDAIPTPKELMKWNNHYDWLKKDYGSALKAAQDPRRAVD